MPADTTAPPAPRPPRPRRWRRKLLILAALALIALIGLRWVSRPSQISWIVLSQAGKALGLEITASGASEYRLRGTPMLEVRDLVAREPGAAIPLLRAERVYLSLPWSTIRAAGAALDVERVELDAPRMDLAALQHWLDTRPPSSEPFRLPSLSDGLSVVRGRIDGVGWSIDDIAIAIPDLHPDRPARGRLRGRVDSSGVKVPFDLAATLQRPALARGLGLAGQVAVDAKDWSLPMRLRLGALLHVGEDGLGLDRVRLAAQARYRAGDTDLPFVYGLAGPLRYRNGEIQLAPLGAAVRGSGVMPNFDAAGRFAFGDAMQLHLDGRLIAWPQAWPALPPPLGQSDSPLPFVLDYRGGADFSGDSALQLRRDQTRFDGRFRLPQVLQWVDAGAQGALLPPLSGTLSTPRIDISGASLQGVEIELEQDPPQTSAPTP